jgi:hypothetical protein
MKRKDEPKTVGREAPMIITSREVVRVAKQLVEVIRKRRRHD